HVINEIMCNHFVSWPNTAQKFNVSAEEVRNAITFDHDIIQLFVSDGLIKFTPDEIRVTDMGRFFVRNIAGSFDPNLKTTTKKFSKSL
ncbi:MAG: coproporphyrinogen III oxidase, partial [Prolixibacteraceae bacterium]